MDVTTVLTQDNVINSFGRSLLSLCSELDLGILNGCCTRILIQVMIYRGLRIGRDGHLDQSEVYDIS